MIRVLVADDHALVRVGVKTMLSDASGITVVGEAVNGRDAVRAAIALKPDVVLMDLCMPVLNGIEALRLIRQEAPTIRVVMLSMHSTAQHVYHALEAGAAGYISKTAAEDELVPAVRAVYAGQLYLPTDFVAAGRRAAIARSPLEKLSARERQVMQLVVEGKSSGDIGRLLHLSRKSVDTYRSRLMKKLGVTDITALVKFAVAFGITPPT
jgi:DNA-binding NarL/FixJ family response regulator